MSKTTYASPNHVVWEYFSVLRHLVAASKSAASESAARQFAAASIVMAVTAAEVFMNIWFLVRIREKGSASELTSFTADLKARKGVAHKLKMWPALYLGKPLDMTTGVGLEFERLRETRNGIVHFTSSDESIELAPNIKIHGVADISEYDALKSTDADKALSAAEKLVAEIFRLAGLTPDEVKGNLHAWIAKL
ncbi:MAG TPA: hypothetical protein VFE23_10655 [Usitatibacter sp.]|jgi:hypothetical protein|nr:hypothetical protein [Usitatibacter sp.]